MAPLKYGPLHKPCALDTEIGLLQFLLSGSTLSAYEKAFHAPAISS